VLWGSYGSFDLDASWSYYYEDRAKYERLREARRVADPDGVFTPKTFCVKKMTPRLHNRCHLTTMPDNQM
jgi:hypothetical protein